MNPNTNEIRDTYHISPEELKRLQDEGFIPVPDDLLHASLVKLAGKKSAKVSFKSNGRLSNWAKKIRYNQMKGKGKI